MRTLGGGGVQDRGREEPRLELTEGSWGLPRHWCSRSFLGAAKAMPEPPGPSYHTHHRASFGTKAWGAQEVVKRD